MTALAGWWAGGGGSGPAGDADRGGKRVMTLLDAMGTRGEAHRSLHDLTNGPCIGIGHLAFRPGLPLQRVEDLVIGLDGRLEGPGGDPLVDACVEVARLYRLDGVEGLGRLQGDFATVIWDAGAGRLICARDALGARPLVYASRPTGFVFASEERGLLPALNGEDVDDLRIAEFLVGVPPPADRGQRPSVFRAPPGAAVVVSQDGIEVRRFAALDMPAPTTDGAGRQAARFRSLLLDAVRRRTVAEPVVDCFLSGGLDSSSIACLAAAQTATPLRTLSLVDDAAPDLSERPFIEAAIAACQPGETAFHDVGGHDPFTGAVAALRRHAGPFAAPNLLMMRPLYEAARAGAVLLDGHGGDEVVSKGVGRLIDLAERRRWIRLLVELRGVADLYGEDPWRMLWALYGGYGRSRRGARLLNRLAARLSPAPSAVGPQGCLALLAEEFRRRSGIEAALESRRRPRPVSGRAAEHALLVEPQQVFALEVLDREGRDAGVEVRFPFWDRSLINYSLALPTESKLRGGWTRMILRDALRSDLPDKVLWRRDKHDFSVQLLRGLRRSPQLTMERLEALSPRLSRYLDMNRVLELRRGLDGGTPPDGADLQALWRVGLLGVWLSMEPAQALRDGCPDVPH